MVVSRFTVLTAAMMLVVGLARPESLAQEKPDALRFVISPQFRTAVPYRIKSKSPDGTLEVRIQLTRRMADDIQRARLPRPAAIAMISSLIEGYYLGFTGLPQSDNYMVFEDIRRGAVAVDDVKVFHVEVKEVGESGKATVKIGSGAAARLAVGDSLIIVRPAGATTAQLRAMPDVLPVTDERGKVAGMNARAAASLMQSINNAKRMGVAMHNFHDVYGRFPPAVVHGPDGKPWHSWRVLVLPFIEQQALHDRYRFDEPWDGPNNRKLLEQVPSVYRDPVYGTSDDYYTHYAVAVGKGTAFTPKGNRIVTPKRWLRAEGGTRIRDFRDGTSNTVLLGSVSPERKIPWTKPEDVVIDDNFTGIGKAGGFAAPFKTDRGVGGVFLRADGSVTTIRTDVDMQLLRNLLQIADGNVAGEHPTLRSEPRRRRPQAVVLDIPRGATSAKILMIDEFPQN